MSSATYRPKFGFDIRINPDMPPKKRAQIVTGKRCASPGCRETAESRVPKNRYDMEDRQWLCRDHLREHNRSWDYFAGMTPDEITRYGLDAITGHRPTWPLGKRAAGSQTEPQRDRGGANYWGYHFEDGYAVFEEAAEPAGPPKRTRLTKGQLDAFNTLNLEENATLQEIKARYKELVKRFHPDANGGNRGTEERLKQVIKAYGHLRATGIV
ncbi:MAG: molecular chaperone DnaJ [Alphaproteobacteria bacterium]|nr:molecular chaperone DnaJ [Alphaproteobacteria bacterium]